MKYTEQAVETLDDAGSVIANKNIEIEQLRQRVAELESQNIELQMNLADTEALEIGTGEVLERTRLRVAELEYQLNTEIGSYASQQIATLTAERDALKQQRDELLAALEDAVSVAKDALDHWDQDRDMKVGKLLHALSGLVNGYDSRADAVHNAIASVKEK